MKSRIESLKNRGGFLGWLFNIPYLAYSVIFFLIPLALAIVHSIFGISFALNILKTINEIDDLVWPIVITAVFIALIYGGYFVITYLSSKNIIKEDV